MTDPTLTISDDDPNKISKKIILDKVSAVKAIIAKEDASTEELEYVETFLEAIIDFTKDDANAQGIRDLAFEIAVTFGIDEREE